MLRRLSVSMIVGGGLLAQVVLIDGTSNDGSFETQDHCGSTYTADGWTVVNGTQTHRWSVGSLAGAHHGNRAIFISDQTDCSAYQYDPAGEDVVHFYRDITVPAGYDYMVVSFYARLQGDRVQAWLYDFLGVYIAPTSVTPTPGTQVSSSYRKVGAALISNEWTYFQTHICGAGGNTYRLIFSWRTTNTNPSPANSGTQPPPAIDRIHVVATNTLPTVTDVPALPYKEGPNSTCGRGNSFSATNVSPYCNTSNVGYNMYRNGEDRVWRFTAPVSGEIRIRIWGTNPASHWMLYEGGTPPTACTDGITGGSCLVEEIWGSGDRTMYACITQGQTYYLIFNQTQSSATATNCGKFDSLLIEPVQIPIYGATFVTALPYSHGPGSTCGQRDRFNHGNSGNCNMTTYHVGNDWIWRFVPATSGNVTIQIQNSSTYTGWAVYCQGFITCNDGLDGSICRQGNINSGGNRTMTVYVHAGVPYYVIVNHYGPPHCGTFSDLTISAPTPATPPSSDPCAPLSVARLSWSGWILPSGWHAFSWNTEGIPAEELRGFILQGGLSAQAMDTLAMLPHDARSFEYMPSSTGTYFYKLTAYTTDGRKFESDILTLSIEKEIPSGIEVIAPPGETKVHVRFLRSSEEDVHIHIYDARGHLLPLSPSEGTTVGEYILDMTVQPAGVYFIRVQSRAHFERRAFIYLPI